MASLQSRRSSGILLHPTSLPSPFGVGDFGAEARAFVDFLAAAGQKLWQVLPLNPTGLGNSPYQSCSAFAGNTLLIDPRQLVDDGLLNSDDLQSQKFSNDSVEYHQAALFKAKLLEDAFENFKRRPGLFREQFESFCVSNAWWLDDYALYRALKDDQNGRDWLDWDRPLAFREPAAIASARSDLRESIEAHQFFQFLFFRQWQSLCGYAHEHDVKIIGDLPIFVAHDSADVWTHREYFKLDEAGKPTVVAGVPPDYFSETGQLWGNPLYDWPQMSADNFGWWIDRMRWLLSLYDLIRVDHFRGFAACWEIPAGDTSAANGQWVEAPGKELFSALVRELGNLPIIAEDLGEITPDVNILLDILGFPGMRVVQFGFGGDLDNIHLPHNYPENVVAYTATHDSAPTVGWFSQVDENEKDFCLRYLHSDGRDINWDFISAVSASAADTTIIPLQDALGLGSEARMNVPNSSVGNWKWRYRPGVLTDEIGVRLKQLTELYGR